MVSGFIEPVVVVVVVVVVHVEVKIIIRIPAPTSEVGRVLHARRILPVVQVGLRIISSVVRHEGLNIKRTRPTGHERRARCR